MVNNLSILRIGSALRDSFYLFWTIKYPWINEEKDEKQFTRLQVRQTYFHIETTNGGIFLFAGKAAPMIISVFAIWRTLGNKIDRMAGFYEQWKRKHKEKPA